MKKNQTKTFLAIVCSSVLAACGGGGGDTAPVTNGGTGGATTGGSTGSTNGTIPLIQSPTLPGASVASEDVAAFNFLNAERDRCGFGKLNWNDQLATAARWHADWQLVNNYLSHGEIAGTPGFTGIDHPDRLVSAGYAMNRNDFASEDEIWNINFNTKVGIDFSTMKKLGENSVRGLFSAPYHLVGMVGNSVDVGIGVRNSDQVGSTASHGKRVVAQFNLAHKTASGYQTPQNPAANEVRTYPCNGTTGTAYQLSNESPNPVPGRDLATNPIGHPILVETPVKGGTLVVTSASVTPMGGSAVALLPALTQVSDTNGFIKANQTILMPNLPLLPSTTYTVVISGTVNGNAFTKNFSFTTGS